VNIGIGLPTTIPGVTGQQVIEWARRADAAGFSSLGTVTERINLTPSNAFLGDFADMLIGWAAKGEDAVKGRVEGFRQVGCDELIMIPCSTDPGQVDKLAATVL
jgi:hypothetical protein